MRKLELDCIRETPAKGAIDAAADCSGSAATSTSVRISSLDGATDSAMAVPSLTTPSVDGAVRSAVRADSTRTDLGTNSTSGSSSMLKQQLELALKQQLELASKQQLDRTLKQQLELALKQQLEPAPKLQLYSSSVVGKIQPQTPPSSWLNYLFSLALPLRMHRRHPSSSRSTQRWMGQLKARRKQSRNVKRTRNGHSSRMTTSAELGTR